MRVRDPQDRAASRTDIGDSAAEFLDEPILTFRAVGTTVVPKEHQRFERRSTLE